MGCGVSKDDIAEPRPMSLVQSRGNGKNNYNNNNINNIRNSINNNQNNNTEPCGAAGQPSKLNCGGGVELPGSTCTKSFPHKPPTPPSVIIAESNWMPRKDGKDIPSPELAVPMTRRSSSRKIRVEEVEYGVHGATALAILSTGTNTPEDEEVEQEEQDEDEEEYVVSGTDLENMNLIGNDMKGLQLPYAVGTFTNAVGQAALIDALVSSTSHTIANYQAMASNAIANNANGFVDFPAMAGGVITISAPDLCSAISPVRKAEIIDLDEDDALATEMSEPKSFGKQQPAHADFWSDGGTDDADTDDPVSRPESTTMREAKKTKSLPLLMLEDPASAPPDDEYDPGDLPLRDYDCAHYKTSDYMMSPAEKLLDDDASVSLSEYLAGLASAQTTPMSVSTELGKNPHRNSTSGTTGSLITNPGTGTGHVSNNNNNVDPTRLIVVAKVPRYNEWASSQADADIESIDLLNTHAAGYLDSPMEPPTLDGHGIHKDSP